MHTSDSLLLFVLSVVVGVSGTGGSVFDRIQHEAENSRITEGGLRALCDVERRSGGSGNKQHRISGASQVDCVRYREYRRGVYQNPVKVR